MIYVIVYIHCENPSGKFAGITERRSFTPPCFPIGHYIHEIIRTEASAEPGHITPRFQGHIKAVVPDLVKIQIIR